MFLRTDPFRDIDRLSRRMFDELGRPSLMAMDAFRTDDEVVVEIDLPGIARDSIELTVEKNVLSVSAERSRAGADGVDRLLEERGHGTFRRRVFLGDALDADGVEADYVDGVLTVRVPLKAKELPRRIEVGSGASRPAVEATASERSEADTAADAA